jgi:hypothetical protein
LNCLSASHFWFAAECGDSIFHYTYLVLGVSSLWSHISGLLSPTCAVTWHRVGILTPHTVNHKSAIHGWR